MGFRFLLFWFCGSFAFLVAVVIWQNRRCTQAQRKIRRIPAPRRFHGKLHACVGPHAFAFSRPSNRPSGFILQGDCIGCGEANLPLLRRALGTCRKKRPITMPWRALRGNLRNSSILEYKHPLWNPKSSCWETRHAVERPVAPPKRVLAVFGAESSGTKMLARVIAHAAGIARYGRWDGVLAVRDTHVEVHHISLPWGGLCDDINGTPSVFDSWQFSSFPHAPRFLVDPVGHCRAHATNGSHCTAVLIHREPTIALLSKQRQSGARGAMSVHCRNPSAAAAENELAYALLQGAIDRLPRARGASLAGAPRADHVVVSYEGIVTLHASYLRSVFRDLAIDDSWDGWVPDIENANVPYVRQLGHDGRLQGAGQADLRYQHQMRCFSTAPGSSGLRGRPVNCTKGTGTGS